MDRAGSLGCVGEGALTGRSTCLKRCFISNRHNMKHNTVCFLAPLKKSVCSAEGAACYKSTVYALCLSYGPVSAWVTISQVETVRAGFACSEHLKALALVVLFTAVSPSLSDSMSEVPGVSVLERAQVDLKGPLGHARVPQSPACASCGFPLLLRPTQVCRHCPEDSLICSSGEFLCVLYLKVMAYALVMPE